MKAKFTKRQSKKLKPNLTQIKTTSEALITRRGGNLTARITSVAVLEQETKIHSSQNISHDAHKRFRFQRAWQRTWSEAAIP